MPLANIHALGKEDRFSILSPSIGAAPVARYAAVPFTGIIRRFVAITQGAITTADCTVTVANNGTTIGTFTIPFAGATAGQLVSGFPSSYVASAVSEDDVLSFTPSGASGASIPCLFVTELRRGI